jgi:hypothetical protein
MMGESLVGGSAARQVEGEAAGRAADPGDIDDASIAALAQVRRHRPAGIRLTAFLC